MRRHAITVAVLALCCCLLAPASAAGASKLAAVKVSSCSRLDHTGSFYGRMSRLPHAERMAMRFTLLVRGPDETRYTSVKAPGLRRWHRSKLKVRAFGYRQRVRGLADGSLYRVQVDYRWYDEDGEVMRRARRRSRTCNQAGPLPNLSIRIVEGAPTPVEGVWRYRVRVTNRGNAVAEDVGVRLSVDGSDVDTRTIDTLEPGAVKYRSFRGPACLIDVMAVVDPDNAMRETAEGDNAQSLTCEELEQR
jgi:CARDB